MLRPECAIGDKHSGYTTSKRGALDVNGVGVPHNKGGIIATPGSAKPRATLKVVEARVVLEVI